MPSLVSRYAAFSPLGLAAVYCRTATFELLVEAKADVEEVLSKVGLGSIA